MFLLSAKTKVHDKNLSLSGREFVKYFINFLFAFLDVNINDRVSNIFILRNADDLPSTVLYFVPDERKSGGSYVTKTGVIKRYDEYEGKIIFTDKSFIQIDNILQIENEILKSYEMIW